MNQPSVITPKTLATIDWTKPPEPASSKTLLAIGIAGLAGAIALPDTAGGIGYFITALACAGAAWLVLGKVRPSTALWGLLSVSLVGITAMRDSHWLFLLCILGACVAASLALTPGRSVGGVVLGSVTVALTSFIALPWVANGLATLRRNATRKSIRIGQSVVVSLILLLVFVPLLAGADAAFKSLLGEFWPTVDGATVARSIFFFMLVAFGAGGACYAIAAPPHYVQANRVPSRRSRVEWALPVGILVLLFTVFAAVQLAAFFGGEQYVYNTAGVTFADYARSGFWQLLAVTVLTLVVVAAAARWAPRETPADQAWLRALLGALCVLTLVIVASALSRMWTYQQVYGFTVQRLVVEAIELWLGVVYLMVIAAGIRLRAGWLPRAIVGSALAGLLVFAWLNPERLIAEHNVARWQQTQNIDTLYLTTLSADAAPALAQLPPELRICALPDLSDRFRDTSWRAWNLSRANAIAFREQIPWMKCRSRF